MNAVALEGLIAYRSDVKQLFFRDDKMWRILRVTYSLSVAHTYKCRSISVQSEGEERRGGGNVKLGLIAMLPSWNGRPTY